MKKLIALVLALALSLVSVAALAVTKDDIKVGFIFIGDENEGYTYAHVKGAKGMQEALGLRDDQIIYKWNTPEDETAYDAAIDLAEQGCSVIFANSFGQESYLFQAADEYADIEFCHATGVSAASLGTDNVHNYFIGIHEARYVSGVVAGMKLNEMIESGKITAEQAKIGYVGAKPFAEVISGYTAFYLGARSVCPSATMEVIYTNEWSDFALEKETTDTLIADGCVMIGQHSDTTGPASACEAAKVYMVGYNIDMTATAPNYALVSAVPVWGPFVTYAVQNVLDGKKFDADWGKGYVDGAVAISALNENAVAPGTAEKVAETFAAIADGSLKVFDCATFTVGGETVTSYNNAWGFEGHELVFDGYFHEGELRSAPLFDMIIDGVTVK